MNTLWLYYNIYIWFQYWITKHLAIIFPQSQQFQLRSWQLKWPMAVQQMVDVGHKEMHMVTENTQMGFGI